MLLTAGTAEIGERLGKVIDYVVEFAAQYGIKLIGALILLIVGLKASSVLVKKIFGSKAAHRMDESLRSFLKSFMNVALDIVIIITAASIMGVPMTSFITILASAGVAIGLALQGSLSNLAGGIMILLFKPFKVGDYIDAGGNEGNVRAITIFYTVLTTVDNKDVTLPNGNLTNQPIINYTKEKSRRVDFKFGVSYSADTALVKRVLGEVAAGCELLLPDSEVFTGLSAYNDSSVEFTLRVWCATEDYWTVYFDINERMRAAFQKNGIEIPFPQLEARIIGK